MILDPDYPHIVLSYAYRGAKIELDQSELNGSPIYAAWVNYATGTALAVPKAWTRSEALKRAQRWVDRKLF
jgi:uncharacterized membrane protein YdcZ (DUF606 family)